MASPLSTGLILMAKKPTKKHPLMLDKLSWDKDKVMSIVLDGLSTSDRGLGQVLEEGHEGNALPNYSTIMQWIADDEKLREMYAHAREAQMDFMQHEILRKTMELSTQPVMVDGIPLMVDDKPVTDISATGVQLARLYTDNMKWTMAKLSPRKYGEKIQQDITFPEGIEFNMSFGVHK